MSCGGKGPSGTLKIGFKHATGAPQGSFSPTADRGIELLEMASKNASEGRAFLVTHNLGYALRLNS